MIMTPGVPKLRSLSRRLGPREGVTVRTSISASDVLEHDGFCVSSLQHFQKLPSRRMSQVSMAMINHLGFRVRRLQVVGWRVGFVEPGVRVPPVICWLVVPSLPASLVEPVHLGFDVVGTRLPPSPPPHRTDGNAPGLFGCVVLRKSDLLVIALASIGTKGVHHYRVVRHEGDRLAV